MSDALEKERLYENLFIYFCPVLSFVCFLFLCWIFSTYRSRTNQCENHRSNSTMNRTIRLFSSFIKNPPNFSSKFNSIRLLSHQRRIEFEEYSDRISHQLQSDIYILNQDGSYEVIEGPFNRAEMCEKYLVEPRDLQKIDTDLQIKVPLIDVRQRKFICFSFEQHRSLVQSNRSIFFLPIKERNDRQAFLIRDSIQLENLRLKYENNFDYIQEIYNERLKSGKSLSIPFEFQLTEISLDSIAYDLQKKTNRLLIEFGNVRENAYHQITVGSLRDLAQLKEKVDQHKRNIDLSSKAILDLLAHDEDLIAMYLSDPKQRDLSDHIQIELLLEASTKQMAELLRSISDLSDSVQTLESAIGFILDTVRNDLLAFEIKINILTMGLGIGAFIAGIFGMNLLHGFEQQPIAFYIVSGSSFGLIGFIVIYYLRRLSKFRKVRLQRTNL